ncbi:hypothetical protein A2V49_00770 [candidate division WWE3 bacterium RBG_19FT_COMBO_34_6]|uniref:16S rRNA (Adenine(1408)-N(1))-methyltransferase n=1 Tax=candidate division WWE3 bacterium RBG_19FT_COMBO_34_6 TaxID=1802612 RepID=A0A1F4UK87_UNCKA|nr:MAG: hypothetical protein A2V49_00770 [candidate division WWE3 bacterium RBG_19FT_COMBO_34_6]
MKIIKGKKILEITDLEFENIIKNFQKVYLDIGTGDGKFVYKNALEEKYILWVGLDPSQKQLEIFSKKINRKKMTNCLLILGSIEILPVELNGKIDKIFVNYPWGSLLQAIIIPSREIIQSFRNLLKPNGILEITFGYAKDHEPSETVRLNLPELSQDIIQKEIIPKYEFENLKLIGFNPNVDSGNSTWAKKLLHGRPRTFYKLSFEKQDI